MIGRKRRAGLLAPFAITLIAAVKPPPVELIAVPPPQMEPEVPPLDEPTKADYPTPPAFIAERISRDRFDPGEFEYLRGYFPEASKEEHDRYAELIAWLDQCWKEGDDRLAAVMAEFDVTLNGDEFSGAASLCQQVVYGKDWIRRFDSYAELAEAARGARLVFDAMNQTAEQASFTEAPRFYRHIWDEINYFELQHYLLSRASSWGETEFFNPERRPRLTEDERVVFAALLAAEYVRVQFARTRWLEEVVERHGWPTVSKVGQIGASKAGLLVAFGDHDPGFQLRMLRVMESEVASGTLDGFEFAEIHDAVMLKLTGKQRYGTHTRCNADGTAEPMPLEHPENVNEWRARIGLEPLTPSGEEAYYGC